MTPDGVSYSIEGTDADECPVSSITRQSLDLIQLFDTAHHVHAASGACAFGPDLSRWPARMVDAQNLIEIERIREHNARLEAEHRASR